MIISACCNDAVIVRETENGGYYECIKCANATKTFCVLAIHNLLQHGEFTDDEITRNN
jgi:hypothetical protein